MSEWRWITCPDEHCRIQFAVPESLARRAIDDGQSVKCPNGHSVVWPGESCEALAEKRIAREREWRRRAEHQVFDEMEEVRELKQMLRTCPVCGWRSTKKRADRIRVDFAQHLSEKHSLAVTEEFEEQMR